MSANPKKPKFEYKPKAGKYNIKKMVAAIEEYIQENKKGIPILKECCLINEWNYDYFMELKRKNPELAAASDRLVALKEINLERGMYTNQINHASAKFSLKQLGWSDRYTVESNVSSRQMSQEECEALATQRLEELRAMRKGEEDE